MENREIKFRAWDEKNKYMWYGDFYINADNGGIYSDSDKTYDTPNIEISYRKNMILMQFTGLTDKNGKELYEGDIVKIPDDYDRYGFMAGETREIYYFDGCFRLKPKSTTKRRGHTIEDDMNYCEVIGNVHENPELLNI